MPSMFHRALEGARGMIHPQAARAQRAQVLAACAREHGRAGLGEARDVPRADAADADDCNAIADAHAGTPARGA